MLISEFLDAIWWKISIESSPPDTELINDISDEWIVFGILEHCFGIFDALLIHALGSAPSTTPLIGSRQPSSGVLNNQFTLEFIEGGAYMEKEPPFWRSGVDVLGQHLQTDAPFTDIGSGLDYLR